MSLEQKLKGGRQGKELSFFCKAKHFVIKRVRTPEFKTNLKAEIITFAK